MWPTDSAPVGLLILLSGLLGGFGHCLGMCGPIVAAFSVACPGIGSLRPHLFYNLGRLTTYALAGGAVGTAGSLLPAAAAFARIQDAVGALAGIAVFLIGLRVAGWLPYFRGPGRDGPSVFGRIVGAVSGTGRAGAFYPLGLVLGLLPCGLVYGALLAAAREGMAAGTPAAGFARGFLVMGLFGAGTAPSLLLAGTVAAAVGPRLRAALSRAAGLAMMTAGVFIASRILWR